MLYMYIRKFLNFLYNYFNINIKSFIKFKLKFQENHLLFMVKDI